MDIEDYINGNQDEMIKVLGTKIESTKDCISELEKEINKMHEEYIEDEKEFYKLQNELENLKKGKKTDENEFFKIIPSAKGEITNVPCIFW